MKSLAYLTIISLLVAILYLNIKQGNVFLEAENTEIVENIAPLNKQDVEKIVAEYIENNPSKIIDSLNNHQKIEADREKQKAQENLTKKADEIFKNPNDPTSGNKNGDVTLVEFFDYACGYCKKVTPHVSRIAKEDPNLRIIYKELPILGKNSEISAKTAIAINNIAPEKYLDYHLKLMKTRVTSKEMAIKLAVDLGVDQVALLKEFDSPVVKKIINDNRRLARALGITGTPAFVIGDEILPGYAEHPKLKAAVKRQRSKK